MNHHPNCYSLTSHDLSDCLCANRKELGLYWRAFILSLIAGGIEIAAVYIGGSVSLFSDVIHIGTDGLSYLTAIVVIGIAFAFPSMTVGTTLGGVLVMLALLVYGDYLVFREAYERMVTPHEVLGIPTLLAAIAGLLLNIVVLSISRRTPKHEQNLRHASIDAHAVSDIAVSLAVIVTAMILAFTEWSAVDWVVAFGVGVYLFFGPIVSLVKRCWQSYTLSEILSPHHHDHTHEDGHDHEHEHSSCCEHEDHGHQYSTTARLFPPPPRRPKRWYELSPWEQSEALRKQEHIRKGLKKHQHTKPKKRTLAKRRKS